MRFPQDDALARRNRHPQARCTTRHPRSGAPAAADRGADRGARWRGGGGRRHRRVVRAAACVGLRVQEPDVQARAQGARSEHGGELDATPERTRCENENENGSSFFFRGGVSFSASMLVPSLSW
eukprot:COSAG06_NODE_15974_length_1031_cov_2.757511_2_plen_124_part_00